ncbi:MAG: ABC transporter ATP-binding protein [Oscillospiraceae bacterium]|jgi:spermidine/putrescine transport system ATP-binding protein|nr:ABC transporter ATP-binding protein [Oscillospiraceae bacterium]
MPKELIRLVDCTMAFDGEIVLNAINLTIHDKEFLTLLGPSGCGKTTTLRLIGGFETPTSGGIFFDGARINDVPPHKRRVNTVFQKYALFPHLNVFENVAFGLRIAKIPDGGGKKSRLPEGEIEERVQGALELVGLKGYHRRRVHQLSGGQQQRVAIARAIVNRPQVLLLDEPLGALDLKLRKEMQHELKEIQRQVGITFVYVTHDQEEALTMSDTVVVMNHGNIQQIGTPVDIYNEPVNAFVADFIGESNIIQGVMHKDYSVSFAGRLFECVDSGFDPNQPVDVVVRPEDVRMTPPDGGQLRGTVNSVTFKGVFYEIFIDVGEIEWMVHSTSAPKIGDEVGLLLTPEDIHVMDRPDLFPEGAEALTLEDVDPEPEFEDGGGDGEDGEEA